MKKSKVAKEKTTSSSKKTMFGKQKLIRLKLEGKV